MLPIITIYFLGFSLPTPLPGVIKVNRQYIDVLHGESISERDEFIECLNYDSYVIQVPRLQLEMKTSLEYVLSIFKQENFHNNDHHIKNYSYETEDELMKKILNRLGKAAGDEKLRKELDLEEMAMREYEKALEPYEQKLRIQEKMIEEKDKALGEKDKILEAMDKVIAEKEKLIRDMMDKLGKNSNKLLRPVNHKTVNLVL